MFCVANDSCQIVKLFLFEITDIIQPKKGASVLIASLGSVCNTAHATLKVQAPLQLLATTGHLFTAGKKKLFCSTRSAGYKTCKVSYSLCLNL